MYSEGPYTWKPLLSGFPQGRKPLFRIGFKACGLQLLTKDISQDSSWLILRHVQTRLDTFKCIWMRSDAAGCVLMPSDTKVLATSKFLNACSGLLRLPRGYLRLLAKLLPSVEPCQHKKSLQGFDVSHGLIATERIDGRTESARSPFGQAPTRTTWSRTIWWSAKVCFWWRCKAICGHTGPGIPKNTIIVCLSIVVCFAI